MFYEFWVGARYAGLARSGRGAKRKDRFVSFIAASSMTGIALGVAALIIVLSVMNGFQTQVRDRMLSVLPHIELYVRSQSHQEVLSHWQALANSAEENKQVAGAAPFVAAQAMLVRGEKINGVQIRGIDPALEHQVSELADQMVVNQLDSLEEGQFGLILGLQLAQTLGVREGDTLMLMAPQGSISPAGFAPRMRQFTVVGLYSSGHYEYDSTLAFVHYEDAARVFRDSGNSGVRLRIHDMQKAPQVAEQLRMALPLSVYVSDWTQNNKTWFAAVQTEKRMMFLILTLIVAVAAFNLLSSLVMAVKDKRSDIAILRTIGATPSSIGLIFLVQGALIGVLGTLIGVSLGALVAYNIDVIVPFLENLTGQEFLPQQIYFISQMPSNPSVMDMVIIGVTSLVLSLLATLYPSWRASKLQPAQVLRHD
ncbi:MAG TPA: lipoprotein-releasing ABC transporter permease subunit [Paenalcaligenes hominis]|uniref:ABC transporter permease n=1 Tax=Paenalcaligenes hominis TaxID=643674 RepID=A0A1U9JYC5_9BURK|nr:lipoprotein-releasing ABC transporter permease subunit [Paenalcaligenes hominis]AQS50795.1 ABC transporter permease [Paenalcaligenes hominis]NJB64254.1 lipoprotein-releasing system permease protein [Paenalcaligenes hominis]GGE69019.1 lipoprotein releasing system protein [Paenalcaligenes hominis]HJH23548.1 lipoprotein-releasing ABC transporter permease subunit [Paenalcaligenes hominis]